MTSKDCSGISEQSFYFAKRFYTIHTSPVLFSDKKIRKNLFLQFFYATLQNKVIYYYRNKMENKEVISTLSEIKNLMEKSSKFLSLSGLSAIFVGIYAFIGAYIAYYILDPTKITTLNINTPYRLQIIVILALILLTISLITAFYLSWIKAKKNGLRLRLDSISIRLLINFFVPLLAGGILCFSLLLQQHYGLTSSIMLIFYGIALINGSKYTYSNTRYLGYAELILGLIDSFVPGYGLLFWVAGFGLFHIIYGVFFYLKYDRRK